jgi:hypothetical protein
MADNVPLQRPASVGSNSDHDAGGLCSENRVSSQKYAPASAKRGILTAKIIRLETK